MAEVVANSIMAVCAKRMPWLRPRILVAMTLAAGTIFLSATGAAQVQYGPPTSGNSAAIFFTPATVGLVAGLNGPGTAGSPTTWGNGGLATAAQLNFPIGIAYDSNGNLYIADSQDYEVRVINHATGDINVFAGTGSFGNSFSTLTPTTQATTFSFGTLSGLAVDSSNNVYFADRTNEVVWKVNTSGVISIFAGNGAIGYTGDGLAATSASITNPEGLAFDASGNLYIADSNNNVVRVVGTDGKINTFAGNGTGHGQFPTCPANFTGAGNAATLAQLCSPQGVAADSSGNVYISSYGYDQVYKVATNGDISVFAGTGTNAGTPNCCDTGDTGPAASAELWRPEGLYVDSANDVYIVDQFGGHIRVVNPAGTITSVYGDGSGDVTKSILGLPDTESENVNVGDADGIYFIAMDPAGDLIVPSADAYVVLTAGTTGQYFFGNLTQIYQTSTTTSLNAFSPNVYPPYITISNPSNVTLSFTGTPVVSTLTPSTTPNVFAIDGGTCTFPGSLPPGTSCTVVVSFTPIQGGNGAGTPYTGSIVLDSNSNSSPNTILLSGDGIGTCQNSATLTFNLAFSSPPNVATAAQSATITNNGNCPYSTSGFAPAIVNPSPATPTVFSVVSNNCPAALNINASCNIGVAFTPAALTSYSARLQVSIPSYGNIFTSLSGTGITAPAVSFSPTSLNFPATNDGATTTSMSTVMTNVGNATLNSIVVSLAGTNPSYFAFNGTNNCGSMLAAGAFCTISVDFTPQAALTNYAATISVADNASGSPQTVALTGTGIASLPPVVINDAETIHTTDAPAVNNAKLVLDAETIHTTDTPALNDSKLILDAETIHTTDTPAINESKLVLDTETIHTTDTPAINESKLILDAETIHTTDTPVMNESKLILDAEVIHTTDTPTEQILTSPTTTVLTSTTATPAAGNPVTFTAKVSSTAGTPTGLVTFYDGTTMLGTGTLTNGTATLATSSLSDGNHSISAVYAGTSLFLTSTSNSLPETVTDFTLSFASSGGVGVTLTILPGAAGTYLITLTPPNNGYTGTITLSASGLPAGATASFSPNPINLAGTPVTSTLTITIPAPMALSKPANQGPFQGPAQNKSFLLLGLLLPLIGARRAIKRSGLRLLALALLSVGIAWGITSCGGNFFTQPSESYTVTITATSGTTQHSGTITLVVP